MKKPLLLILFCLSFNSVISQKYYDSNDLKYYLDFSNKNANLKFQDCSQLGDKYLKQLHIRFSDNSELVGVDAFIYVWKNTSGFQFFARLINLPIIYTIAKMTYKVVALILFYRFKIKKKLVS